jgi:hypothetical protein
MSTQPTVIIGVVIYSLAGEDFLIICKRDKRKTSRTRNFSWTQVFSNNILKCSQHNVIDIFSSKHNDVRSAQNGGHVRISGR